MADKPTGGPDTSLAKPAPESEQKKAPGQETPAAPLPAPQQVIEQFEQFFAGGISPVRNPVLEKVNEDHITTALELAGKNDERTFADSKADRRYRMAYILIGIIAFFVLTVYMMPADKELYKQIVQLLIAAGGGFRAGYGVRHWQG